MMNRQPTICSDLFRNRLRTVLSAVLFSAAALIAAPQPEPDHLSAPASTNLEAIVAERKAEEAGNISAVHAQLMEAIHKAPDAAATPMSKVSLPFAHHPNGRVRATLSADYALFPAKAGDYLRARNITLQLFNPIGELDAIFLADDCVFDSSTKMGYCNGPVRLLYRRIIVSDKGVPSVDVLEITGTNMVLDVENDNTKVTIPVSPVVKINGFMDGLGKVLKK